jgi:hypothetical protein
MDKKEKSPAGVQGLNENRLSKYTNFSNIPDALKELNQWVLWKLVNIKGRKTKIPYQANGQKASSNNPETWIDFDSVIKAYNTGKFSGIGFVFTKDTGIVGIDIDAHKDSSHKLVENGQIVDKEVLEIVESLNSYTEITQSGKGLHTIVFGAKPGSKCKKGSKNFDVEIYDHDRFFVMTGNVVKGYETINSNQDAINTFYNKYFEQQKPDNDIYSKIAKDKKLSSLLSGNLNGYTSESERDLSVCNHLAKYTNDATIIDQVIRKSQVFRSKWDEKRGLQTYGEITIQKALSNPKQATKQYDNALNDFMRVGDTYYKNIILPDGTEQMQRFSRQTIIDDFGKDALKQIRKFNSFVYVPDNLNYRQEINNCLNLYSKPIHEPKEGKFDTILHLIKHIFGEQYEYGLDYLQLLYLKPKQMLPVLALVSKENGTGKTTFAEFKTYIFGSNATIIGIPEFSSDFNSVFATKLIVCIEEGRLHDGKLVNKLKSLSTSNSVQLRKMHREHQSLDFYGKFLILSNHETSFLNMENNDIRYWVRKVPAIEAFETDYKKKLKNEVPAFLHFLINRKLVSENKSRMWFAPDVIFTDDLQRAKRESWSTVAKDLVLWLVETMQDKGLERIDANLTDLWEKAFYGSGKVTRSEIKRALKNELQINPSEQSARYTFLDISKTGTYYSFIYDELINIID